MSSISNNGFIVKLLSVEMDGFQVDQLLDRHWNSFIITTIYQLIVSFSDFHQLKQPS